MGLYKLEKPELIKEVKDLKAYVQSSLHPTRVQTESSRSPFEHRPTSFASTGLT